MAEITDRFSSGDRAEIPIWKRFYQACDPISEDRIIARVLRRIRRPFYRRIFLSCGRNLSVHGGIAVCGGGNITLGDQVQLHGLCALYAANGKLRIGNRSAIGRNSTIDASEGEITIGEDCLIAANSVLRAADHVYIDRRIPISRQGHRSGSIVLESDVWLGANVVVLRGVRISKGAVVGAGSVVTRDLPEFAVAVGAPARVIRLREE